MALLLGGQEGEVLGEGVNEQRQWQIGSLIGCRGIGFDHIRLSHQSVSHGVSGDETHAKAGRLPGPLNIN